MKDSEKLIITIIASFFIYIFSGQSITIGYILIFSSIYFTNKEYKKIPLTKIFNKLYIVIVFCLYCLLMSFQAIDTKNTVKYTIKIGAILSSIYIICIFLDNYRFNLVGPNRFKTIISMLIIVNIIVIVEYCYFYPISSFLRNITSFNNSLRQPIDKFSFLLSLTIPTIFIRYYKDNILFWILIILTTINYLINPVLAGTISYFFSFIVMFLYFYFGKKIIELFFSTIVLHLYFSPIIFKIFVNLEFINKHLETMPKSWMYRVLMWKKTVQMIYHKPFFGYGLNCSNKTNNLDYFQDNVILELHPHNIFLQLWLEIGAVGVIIFSIFLIMLFRSILSIKNQQSQLVAIGIVSTFFIYGNISYGLWQTWLLCSLAISIIMYKICFNEKCNISN